MAAVDQRPVQEEAESIWIKCASCQEILFRKEVERRLFVCPKCNAHLRLTVEQRLLITVDGDHSLNMTRRYSRTIHCTLLIANPTPNG